MKTIVNKTHAPLRVPLPQGKVLHLGPLKEGQISHKEVDHEPLQRLIEEGKIEVRDEAAHAAAERRQAQGPHELTHGHHPPTTPQVRGDR